MLVSLRAAGMGDVSLWNCLNPLDPTCAAAIAVKMSPSFPTVGAPPVPTADQLAAPWTGTIDQAQQAMVDEQMRRQQAANAAGVQTTVGSEVGGALYNAGEAVAPALPWVGIALLGIGILALWILLKR